MFFSLQSVVLDGDLGSLTAISVTVERSVGKGCH